MEPRKQGSPGPIKFLNLQIQTSMLETKDRSYSHIRRITSESSSQSFQERSSRSTIKK